MSNTAKIFSDNCPYNNSYQTQAMRILFVCSVGMLRSPTAQAVATTRGHNARACGSNTDIALIPLSVNLINWADQIIFMNHENYIESCKEFEPVGYKEDIESKSIIWNISDDYSWGDPVLWRTIEDKLANIGL